MEKMIRMKLIHLITSLQIIRLTSSIEKIMSKVEPKITDDKPNKGVRRQAIREQRNQMLKRK